MKKLALAIACSSIALSPAVFADTDTEVANTIPGSSYVTGNVQFHSTDMHGADATSTLEAGHTFTTGTTLLVEFDGIQIGELAQDNAMGDSRNPTYITLGAEQSYNINDNFWVAAGYHHLLADGDSVQYRPLIKLGYNFDNGISISNRTRWHLDANNGSSLLDTRMDNAIAYTFSDAPLTLKYNNIYMLDSEAMDHEFRATWNRVNAVQPYVEFRSQGNNIDNVKTNNALVIGASYGF